LAPGKHVPPSVVLADKNARIPLSVTAPPAARRPDGAAHVAVDSGESKSTVRDQLVVAHNATVQTAAPGIIEPAAQSAPLAPIALVAATHRGEKDWRALEAQLEALRDQLTKVKDEAKMPDHAVAALMVSDHPELASLIRLGRRRADHGGRKATIEIFDSDAQGESMVAVVLTIKNPRDAVAWEPTEARVKVESQPTRRLGEFVRWGATIPAAVRSVPVRIIPGQVGRIVVVFDKNDVGLVTCPVVVELLREGKWEFEFTLQPSDLVASSRTEEP